MKKLSIYFIVVIIALIGTSIFFFKDEKEKIVENQTVQNGEPAKEAIGMCYKYSKETSSGFSDRAWLRMSITGDKVTGEYQNLPAEKDSKVGKFSGTVGKMDPKISGRIADVMWESEAEGMSVTEELKIEFGEGSAVALFGEMVDRGDGVYVYKDNTKLTPSFQMSQIDCQALDSKTPIEKNN